MSDILPAPVAWLRVAPASANPDEIDLPNGCSLCGYQTDHDGFITLLIRQNDLPAVDEGGVIPLVRIRWIQPKQEATPQWEVTGTFEDE